METASTLLALVFGAYYVINAVLMMAALWSIKHQMCYEATLAGEALPMITIIVPAYNESLTIVETVKTILGQKYHNYRLVVVNDGSSDGTLETLIHEFGLEPTSLRHKDLLLTKRVRGSYASRALSKLTVLDKENGGKSDAINAGLNAAKGSDYVCVIDADVVLEKNALRHAMQAIGASGANVVAAGGNIRIGNGSEISDGQVKRLSTPGAMLPLFQILEYLRSFSLFRLGWNPLNAVAILSGAFGIFRHNELMHLGGYQKFSKGEDMEITLRLHESNLRKKTPYRIVQLVRPLSFTGAPSTLKELAGQRRRWQVGLLSCLKVYGHLLFRPRYGALGLVALPYLLVFEALSPFLEIGGYLLIVINFFVPHRSPELFIWFLVAVTGGALLVNLSALLVEACILRLYTDFFDLGRLFLAGILEPFGYHQMNQLWKIQATFGFFRNIQLRSSWQPPKRD